MEKLALYIKDCIKQQKTDNPDMDDEDLFDVVLEDISSMVLDYTFWDYEMDIGVGKDWYYREDQIMERIYYIVEVEGEGCYCLCYDDKNGDRVVVDWDLEMRED